MGRPLDDVLQRIIEHLKYCLSINLDDRPREGISTSLESGTSKLRIHALLSTADQRSMVSPSDASAPAADNARRSIRSDIHRRYIDDTNMQQLRLLTHAKVPLSPS